LPIPIYSYFKASTGFAQADFKAMKLTVSNAIKIEVKNDTAKIMGDIEIL